jgi:hypothetical protein
MLEGLAPKANSGTGVLARFFAPLVARGIRKCASNFTVNDFKTRVQIRTEWNTGVSS